MKPLKRRSRNAEARAWRDRKKPGHDQYPVPVELETQEIPTDQLDLEL